MHHFIDNEVMMINTASVFNNLCFKNRDVSKWFGENKLISELIKIYKHYIVKEEKNENLLINVLRALGSLG